MCLFPVKFFYSRYVVNYLEAVFFVTTVMSSVVLDPRVNSSDDKTFLQDFLENLEEMFHRYCLPRERTSNM